MIRTTPPSRTLAAAVFTALVALATPVDAQAATNVTVYSGDFESVLAGATAAGHADVTQAIRRDLRAGQDEIALTGLPSALDLGGVRLEPANGARVVGQRYDFATAAPNDVLARALGKTVTVRTTGGEALEGTLLGRGDGLTLATANGVRVVRDYIDLRLPALPEGLAAEPTLRFAVDSRGGSQGFALRYPTGGLAWRAEYAAVLADNGRCRLNLSGAALVANRSGADFADAALTLIAGEPRRDAAPQVAMKAARVEAMTADFSPSPEPAGDYQAYRLPGRHVLSDGSVQRVPLIADATGVPCERRYETRAGVGWWNPPQPLIQRQFGGDGQQPVVSTLSFDNAQTAGLGVPLPAGRIRVDEADGNAGSASGHSLFGEARLGHTPAGERIELDLGTAFDLRAERTQTDFRLDRSARLMEEDFTIELRNGGQRAATVRAVEALPRWSDWEIVAASAKWTKLDAQTIAFDQPVPAEGKTRITYTVRYRWPADLQP